MANTSKTEFGIGYDTTFELTEFGQPRLRSELEVVKNTILFLLFCKPGQYPSLPHIGLDINSLLYSFYDELDTDNIKNDLIAQCEALGVCIKRGIVNIQKMMYQGHPSLFIHIEGFDNVQPGYVQHIGNSPSKYMIGITFDDLNKMIYNVTG